MVEPASMPENLPLGYRFHPTDQELVAYLKRKLNPNIDHPSDHRTITIPEIDLCKYDPWDIPFAVPATSAIDSDDEERFFFSRLSYKYPNSARLNRATPGGYWKVTGKDTQIKVRGTNIGTKKFLVFYEGRVAPCVKTNYVIHEYHGLTFPDHQRTYVLCRLKLKPQENKGGKTHEPDNDEREQSNHTVSTDENPEEHCFSNPGLMIQEPFDLDEFVNSLIQTPLKSDEFVNPLIQTPLKSDEMASAMIQTPLKSDEFVNPSIQTPLKSDEMASAMIQKPLNSNDFLDSTIHTPDESYEFLDSSIETPLRSNEFYFNLPLQLSPGI